MSNKKEYKPMSKGLIYSLFTLKFLFGLVLIWWTIWMTLKSDVGQDDDNAFLSTYHKVDVNYNNMMIENIEFAKKYNIKFIFNDHEIIGLSHNDVFLSQRVIKERPIRKNMIKVGQNKFTVLVQDKDANNIETKKIDILVTKNTNHKEDVHLNFINEDSKEFKINSIGHWNITGTVEVDGTKGSFYIKTNATDKTK
ncbi:MAG: hypothetical protein U9R37_05595 [Campylobacterota bacterium]|nr:hypothetical protein [Campylobacterota bacterium]